MKKPLILFVLVIRLGFSSLYSEELPKPNYDNSLIFSWTYYILNEDVTEFGYLQGQFGKGIYAPLCFSTFIGLDMAWSINPADADNGIQEFKNDLDEMISFAKVNQVGIHLTLTYGICRNVTYYNTAKIEDLRNCQWYNDNNISSQAQQRNESKVTPDLLFNHADDFSKDQSLANDSVVNQYVFSTPSRYARKLRAHLEAKVSAAFAYIKQRQDANPGVIIIISAPGEAELNYYRLDNSQYMQDYFCDYSPFAVLEFRDWIKHEGLYATGEKYAGEGYTNGGSRYQGASGLANFNADFGTSFTTWDLEYYNWSLSDPVDTDYTDSINPDPKILPVSQYIYNGMMPTSGSNYIAGGFDPPRVMQDPGTNDFYDLWHTFRETMLAHYVKDMASIARNSGFPKKQYYTHQIPADYLLGTRPNDPSIPYLNPRYYSSASPLWTANAYPDTGLGVTLYDINFDTGLARTTLYGIGAASALSDNWAATEYNPDVIPEGVTATLSSVQTIYNQMMLLYNGNPHVVSFYKWEDGNPDTNIYKYKGTNRGTAAKQFFDAIKDKARQPISTVFTPKKVENFTVSYNSSTGLVNLSWSPKIWTDLSYTWADWGNFKEFVIYRGYTRDFTANSDTEIKRTTLYSFRDSGFTYGKTIYYKLAAVNTKGQSGPIESKSVVVPIFVPKPVLAALLTPLNFCHITGQAAPPAQTFHVKNSGTGTLKWSVVDDAEWLTCNPSSAMGDAWVAASVNPGGLSQGTYSGTITISAPTAADSPQTLTINLTVKDSSQDQMPFGRFDTPVDRTRVMSSIPVTGWALDDVGISKVQLFRDPVTGEGQSLIYIGDADLVRGARPDIRKLYPDYPCNYKSGWGYMMLTNFLPNSGNGTFTIYAIATDTSGKQVTLGTKTITCKNAHAVKPFGAIDTPVQGGEAAGSQFKNWGWVLTPMPNSIPTNGSTIDVYVDGVILGHPQYNIYRSDVASLFPGYANSNGSAGYFTFDTTQYRDGTHTILWTAMDIAGNIDGIGSRYFTIRNAATGYDTAAAADFPTAQKKTSAAFYGNLQHIPVDYSAAIRVKTGFSETIPPQTLSPGIKGITTLQIRELERVEIHFTGETLTASPLPIGSTLDSGAGIFYWQPGPGFLGEYRFDFVVKEGTPGEWKRQPVKIKIAVGDRRLSKNFCH